MNLLLTVAASILEQNDKMYNKFSCLIGALLLFMTNIDAQDRSFSFNGRVLISKDRPAQAASIHLIKFADKQTVAKTITDEDGNFRLTNLLSQLYVIEIGFVGYKSIKKSIQIKEEVDSIWTIILEKNTDTLTEVVVKAVKPVLEYKPGLTVYNVSLDPAALGKSLSDVVVLMPGVAQNGTGALTVNGESDVTILINGRRSRINATDMVQQLQSANVERVELMSGADPRYASTTGSAVLNIILKKSREKTFSGNSSLLVNQYGFLNASFRGSKSNGKRNAYFVVSDDEKFMQSQSSYIRNQMSSDTIFFSGNSKNNVHHSLRTITIGTDLYIDSFNTINIENSLNLHSDKMRGQTNNTIGNFLSGTTMQTLIQSLPNEIENILGLNYRKQFRGSEKYFETDFSTAFFGLGSKRRINNKDRIDELNINSSAYQFKTELFLPFRTGNSLLMGIDLSVIESVNQEKTENQSGNIVLETVNFTNQKAAFFSALTYRIGKRVQVRPGMRVEHVNTNAAFPDNSNTKFSLLSIYPTLNISWQPSQRHHFSMDYLRRINHPGLAEFYTSQNQPDTFQIHQGNPNLIPVIRNNLSLDYRYKKGKANVSFRFFGNIINNSIRMVTNYLPNDKVVTQLENIGTLYAYGAAITTMLDMSQKWKLRMATNLNFSSLVLKKKAYIKFLDFYDFNSMISGRYVFSKKNDAEMVFRMMNYSRNLNDDFYPGYNLSFHYNYKFKDEKLILSLTANDILFTMKFRSMRYLASNILSEQNSFMRSRYIQIVLNYKFGGEQKKREKRIQSERVLFSNG